MVERGLVRQQRTRQCARVQRVRATTRFDHVPRFSFTPIRTKVQLWFMRAMNVLPKEQREWGRAVISELNEISGFWNSLEWLAGGVTAMSKAAPIHHTDRCLAKTTWPGTA